MQDVNNRGSFVVGRGLWEFSILFAQFFCKPKTALKNGHRLGAVLCLDRVKSVVGVGRTASHRHHTHPPSHKLLKHV